MASSHMSPPFGIVARPVEEPPEGPPWDLAPLNAPLVYIDLEMTGLNPDSDAIVELALIRSQGGNILHELSSLIATDRPMRPEALALHGLRIQDRG